MNLLKHHKFMVLAIVMTTAIAFGLIYVISQSGSESPSKSLISSASPKLNQSPQPKSTSTSTSTPVQTSAKRLDPEPTPEPAPEPTPVTPTFSQATVTAQTQYSHTENGHSEGQVYAINATPVTLSGDQTKTISGSISRERSIGLEKGSIVINYSLVFNGHTYVSGSIETISYSGGAVRSPGYVTSAITLTPGQSVNQPMQFIESSSGYAGSGSYIYPITAYLNLN